MKTMSERLEEIKIIRDICGTCGREIRDSSRGHPYCLRQSQQEEAMANLEWNRKQELRIDQARLEVEKNAPKTPEELRKEKLELERLKWQKEAQRDQRKQKLVELEEEAANLRRLIAQEET